MTQQVKMFDDAVSVFPDYEKELLLRLTDRIKISTYEIRFRLGRPVMLYGTYGCGFLTPYGFSEDMHNAVCVADAGSIEKLMCRMTSFSVYSRKNEIAQGFVTYGAGHRAGLCGTAVTSDGRIHNVRNIDSVNIRIAGLHAGVSDSFFKACFIHEYGSYIISGPPCCGKTTFLRDLAENISRCSALNYPRVTVIDERYEFAGLSDIRRLDMCDILRGYSKSGGTVHALRTLSPDVIICDEAATEEDAEAIVKASNSGVRFLLSIHAGSISELKRKQIFRTLVRETEFCGTVLLSSVPHPCTVSGIYKTEEIFNETDTFIGNHADFRHMCV